MLLITLLRSFKAINYASSERVKSFREKSWNVVKVNFSVSLDNRMTRF